jgi:ABC-type uncharacterized transport system auxiliary subunit
MSAGTIRALFLLSALLATGCSTPPGPRYFEATIPETTQARLKAGPVLLRLRKVAAATQLDLRIMWRKGDVERGFYELERWSESPGYALWRALKSELFERRGLRSGGPSAPYALDVDLTAFEEILLPTHQVRVRLEATLADKDERALRVETFESVLSVKNENAQDMARAMGIALGEAVRNLVDAVVQSLRDAPPIPEGG